MKDLRGFHILFRVALLGSLLSVPGAYANTIFAVDTVEDLVDSDIDDGVCATSADTCSLRAAIMQANHLGDPGFRRIVVPAGTYTLTLAPGVGDDNAEDKGDLNVTAAGQGIEIVGAGATNTVVDGNQLDGVMKIDVGGVANIHGITIRNGYRRSGSQDGGGIDNRGTLSLSDSIVESNRVELGCCRGGGIASTGVLGIVRTAIRSNAAYQGGGLFVGGRANVYDSTLDDNSASFGGAIYHYGSWPDNQLHISNSTLSGNHALQNGGGILNSGNVFLVNSTLSNNDAADNGGGFFNLGNAFFYSSSVIGNDSDHDHDENGGIGGGIYTYPGHRTLVVNSLIAGNTTAVFTGDECNGTLEVYGWNLFAEVVGCVFSGNGTSSRGLVSPGTIGPLQDNGGPTSTHALLAGSEAIDSTTSQGCIDDSGSPLTTDQRGAPRGAGQRCDVGASEYGATVPIDDFIFSDGFESAPER
jgi:hypothetical protein